MRRHRLRQRLMTCHSNKVVRKRVGLSINLWTTLFCLCKQTLLRYKLQHNARQVTTQVQADTILHQEATADNLTLD